MKRRMILLTEAELETLRALARTGAEEETFPNGGEAAVRYRVIRKLNDPPTITSEQWRAYQLAAGELLEAGAADCHEQLGTSGREACYRFADAVTRAFDDGRPIASPA